MGFAHRRTCHKCLFIDKHHDILKHLFQAILFKGAGNMMNLECGTHMQKAPYTGRAANFMPDHTPDVVLGSHTKDRAFSNYLYRI